MKKKFFLLVIMIISSTFVFAERSIVVSTFNVSDNAITKAEAETITDFIITELVKTGKVNIVDRTKFDKTLAKMNFQNSDLLNRNKAIEAANAANAELITYGQITKRGGKTFLSAFLVDVETTQYVLAVDKFVNSIDDILYLLTFFVKEVVAGLRIKIGDIGPGGGIVFYSYEEKRCLECSNLLGYATFENAKKMCEEYRGGGYSDWYLPTEDELNLIYQNLQKNSEAADLDVYWSSTSISSNSAHAQQFYNGTKVRSDKRQILSVVAIRDFTY